MDFKMKGDYMKPFMSFYDPKAMEPPYNPMITERFERTLLKEIEISIKQVRSSKNLSTKLRKNVFI
jgi:hypothetical protein